jgi:predicted ATPase/DNA-binding SARP family transcriptional activator
VATVLPDSAGSPLSIRLFGPCEVRVHGVPLPRLRSRKGYWLLALLALRRGAQVDRAWLAAILWPDSPEPQALGSLRISLKDLRGALGVEASRLRSPTSRTLALDLVGAQVDVLGFDAAVARGDPGSLAAACSLYRGPLLEECAEEWVFQERQARAEAHLAALERLAAEAMSGGDPARAERYARRAVAVDPLRESAHRGLMEAQAAGGNYAAVLATYRELRLLLHRELNAEVDAETRVLYEAIRAEARQKAALPAPSCFAALPAPPLRSLEAFAHNLPAQWTRFIGRERTMAEVKRLLTGARLLTLTGIGGCGKTRLALQVAADLLAQYDDGVWLVELASLADPALVPRTMASTLGLREDPARSPVETLLSYLRPRALLLLLDNCEHLLSPCAELAAELLRGCPQLRLLATSREELGIVGEQTYPVPPLSLPDPTQLPPLERLREFEAVQLFADRAALSQPSFVVTRANATAVAQVCHHLDGIPLAIELAARVKVMSVEQLAGRLEDVFRLLTGGSRTALPRQRTLRAMIDWSYNLLSEEERALLRRLSVFAGGWTLPAAEAVCADNGEVLDLLTQLAEKSLVEVEQQAGVARYRFLETVRQYSRERLNEAGEADAARSSHLEFFLRLAEEAEPNLTGPDRRAWLERLDREHDNLRAALEWSRASGNETALRLAGALFWFWNHRGHAYEGRVWLEKALSGGRPAAPGPARTASRAKALWAAGTLAWIQCHKDAARPRLEESLTIWQEVGDKQGLGRSLRELGNVLGDQGDLAMARSLHERSAALFRETANKWDLALSLAMLGADEVGDDTVVRSAAEESLALYRGLRDEWGIALALEGLGLHAGHKGDHSMARSLFEEALAGHRAEGDTWNIAELLNLLGEVAQRQGEPERAAQLFRESLPLHRDVGDRGAIAIVFHNLGAVAQLQGQHGRAARLFAAAEALREGGIGTPRYSLTDRADRERDLAAVRAALGEEAFAAAWAEGRAMPFEQAISDALTDTG